MEKIPLITSVRATKMNGQKGAQEPPPGWGSDPVSEFINRANQNTYATYARNKGYYNRLRLINDIYLELLQHWANDEDILTSLFFLRTHASYLGAIRFSLSCQVPEAFLVMRGCLENALFGIYVYDNIPRQQVWIDRDKSASSRKKVQDEFRISNIFHFLERMDPKTCSIARELYDCTIDNGAHPNRKAVLAGVRLRKEGKAMHLDMQCITDDNVYSRLGLKRNMQVGLCSLMIFRNVYMQRYDLLGLTKKIDKLMQRL